MKNLVIGITGGIGSGKSTFSEIVKEFRIPILISDEIARQIMETDDSVISEIKKAFGNDCYKDNSLIPKVLAEKVFGNQEKIELVNSIVHPPTIKKIEQDIQKLKNESSLIFVESALIFEANMEDLFDYILLVTADEDTRIKRIMNRGIETISEIKDRMKHQISEDSKKVMSDFVLENNSTLENLRDKASFFINLFKQLSN